MYRFVCYLIACWCQKCIWASGDTLSDKEKAGWSFCLTTRLHLYPAKPEEWILWHFDLNLNFAQSERTVTQAGGWKAVVEIGGKLLEDWQHTGSGGHRPEPEVKEAQSETIAWQKLTCVVLLSVATSFHVIFVTRIVKTVLILVLTHYYYCNYLPGWFGAQFREELFKFLRHNRLSTAHKRQLTKLFDKRLYLCLF